MELMVVVVLVALLAALAAPSFSEARNDRIAFDYGRQFQQVLVQARARAAGTGAAHLVLLGPGAKKRGFARLYQAADGTAAPGPNPVSSCRADPIQWNEAVADPPNLAGTRARFVDFADINRGGVNDDMNLSAELRYGTSSAGTTDVVQFVAVCITPAGVTYVGADTAAAAAISTMRTSSPFNGLVEVNIQRHLPGTTGAGIGLKRRLVLTGGSAPRLRSE